MNLQIRVSHLSVTMRLYPRNENGISPGPDFYFFWPTLVGSAEPQLSREKKKEHSLHKLFISITLLLETWEWA